VKIFYCDREEKKIVEKFKMTNLKVLHLLIVANFLSFGLQTKVDEELTQFRQQSGT
jgi:hypothetical protein